jgi:hypothetical protein
MVRDAELKVELDEAGSAPNPWHQADGWRRRLCPSPFGVVTSRRAKRKEQL